MNQKIIKGGRASNRGITLIALVITIIVLLILAGVTINMVLGEDGIIGQAQGASEAQKLAQQNEDIELDKADYNIRKIENKVSDSTETSKGSGTSGDEKNTFKEIVTQVLNDEGSTGGHKTIELAVEDAKTDGNYIKLNKNVYLTETISVGIFDDEEGDGTVKSLVIDLNGYDLIWIGAGTMFDTNYEYGRVYITDSSEVKTGKIKLLRSEDFTYVDKCDVNRDGAVCQEDWTVLMSGGYLKKEGDPEWEKYKNCDINGDKTINGYDFDDWGYLSKGYCRHLEDIEKIYLDLGENAIITECGCNK